MEQTKLLGFLQEREELMTLPELSHILKIPTPTLQKQLDELKRRGQVQEITIEQLLVIGK